MYEASFGLKRRPFAATPDATCFLASGPIQAALDELVVCVEQGQGIAIMTSPAGTGKTLLCERLRSELDDRYETVFLRHASFLTRRALLQTILCELNYSYHHPSEQELRLELFPAIRALQPKREALVLICDEAHQLSDSLLEELRILADFAEAGRPLVRLVLVGQLALEEKLAQPGLEAFNQRIRAQVNLNTFDHAESVDYIDYRITWAGGRTDEIFTPEALDLIARVSDGVPRCINQLADHALLLAFVAEQRPVQADLVREALNDLRQLPLHWNEPPQSLASSELASDIDSHDSVQKSYPSSNRDSSGLLETTTSGAQTYSFESGDEFEEKPSNLVSFETDAVLPVVEQAHSIEVGGDDWRQTMELFNPRKREEDLIDTMKSLIPELSDSNSSEESQSKLSRRIQFHNLVQDAYDNAPRPRVEPSKYQQSADEIDGCSDTVVIPREHIPNLTFPISSGQYSSANPSNSIPVTVQPANGFHEEVIVDRYTSIDAGLQPPEMSLSDTIITDEVRAEFGQQSQFSPTSQATAVQLDSSTIRAFPGDELHAEDRLYATPAGTSTSFESIVSTPSVDILRDDYETKKSPEYDVARNSPSWPDDLQHDYSTLRMQRDTATPSDVEGVVNDVCSLGESLRPFDSLSSNSDSILKSLRSEVENYNRSESAQTPPEPPAVPNQAAWESIETAPVEKVEEARPFRYLFSMLRRKQQGL